MKHRAMYAGWLHLTIGTALTAFCFHGCSRQTAEDETSAAVLTADEILQKMTAAYAEANSYSDRGIVRLRYKQANRWKQDEAKFSVQFARPNRLAVHAYQLTLASDGRELRAMIADRDTRDMDGQVLLRPTPERLRLEFLYDDPVVLNVVASGMGGPPATLELLLADKPLKDMLRPEAKHELLPPEEVNGRACHRVRATIDAGAVVFWIDRESFVLRRLEYPTAGLAEQMAATEGCTAVTLTAEFRDATLDRPVADDGFRLALPAQAKLVRRFVLPPKPTAPALLGQVPVDFHFTDLDGRQVTRDALRGRIGVLAWFNNHPASQASLEQLNELPAGATVYAVCTEPATVGNEEVKRLAESWGLRLPIVRDLEAFGRDAFQVPWAPTVVVLDPRGVVQAFEVGADPALGTNLAIILRRLSNGDDLAAEVLARNEQERRNYEAALAEASRQVAHEARAAAVPPGMKRE